MNASEYEEGVTVSGVRPVTAVYGNGVPWYCMIVVFMVRMRGGAARTLLTPTEVLCQG